MQNEKWVCVARIVNSHGLRGDVKIETFTTQDFSIYKTFFTKDGVPLALSIKQKIKDNLYMASVENIKTREDAQNLKGVEVCVSSFSMLEIDENEHYYHDLMGCFVVDEVKNDKGVVSCVHNFGAGDVLEITKDRKTFFCPFHVVVVLDKQTLLVPGAFFVE